MLKNASWLAGVYPDTECEALCRAISEEDGIPAENIVCTSGAAELFTGIVRALRPAAGLILVPAFSEYERCLDAAGAKCIFTDNGEDFIRLLPEADVAFLCNPVSPTGVLLRSSFLAQAVTAAEEAETTLVVDESFLRFCRDFPSRTVRKSAARYRKLVVADSFTKFYGIPGLRLGFGVTADRMLRAKIRDSLPLWNVSGIAQAAGVLALKDRGYRSATLDYMDSERPRFTKLLEGEGLKVTPGEADFIFFASERELYRPLLEVGVLIRDCRNFRGMEPGVNHYRVAVRRKLENEELVRLISDIYQR